MRMLKFNWMDFMPNVTNLIQFRQLLSDSMENSQGMWILTLNLDVLRQLTSENDDEFIKNVCASTTRTADGFPIKYLNQIQSRAAVERLAGSDIVFDIVEISARHKRPIFVAGGQANEAERAATSLMEKYVNSEVTSIELSFGDVGQLTKELSECLTVDEFVLMLGAGSLKSEKVIANLIEKYPKATYISCGAAISYMAETRPRSPKFLIILNMEWLWRFSQEPKRLFVRYFLKDLPFLATLSIMFSFSMAKTFLLKTLRHMRAT